MLTLVEIIYRIIFFLNGIVPLIIGLAVLFFLWGVFKFFFLSDSDEDKKSGRGFMIYGIIALFVMVSVWALIRLIADIFEFELGGPINVEEHSPSDLYRNYLKN